MYLIILGWYSPICYKNVCCDYSLEAPWKLLLVSSHNICFYEEIRKVIPELAINTVIVQMFTNFAVSINLQTFIHMNGIFLYRNIKANLLICEFKYQ